MLFNELFEAGLIEVQQEGYFRFYKFNGKLFDSESALESFVIGELYELYHKEQKH